MYIFTEMLDIWFVETIGSWKKDLPYERLKIDTLKTNLQSLATSFYDAMMIIVECQHLLYIKWRQKSCIVVIWYVAFSNNRNDKVKRSDSTSNIHQPFEQRWDVWKQHKQIQRPFKPHKMLITITNGKCKTNRPKKCHAVTYYDIASQ